MVGCLTPPGAKNHSGCDLSPSGSFPSEEPAFYHTPLWKRRLGKTQDVAWEIQLFLSPSKSDQQHDYAAFRSTDPAARGTDHSSSRFAIYVREGMYRCAWSRPTGPGGQSPLPLPHFQLCPPVPAPGWPEQEKERIVSRDIAKFSFMLWCWKSVCSFIIKLSLKAARLPGRAALRNACSALANLLLRNSHYPGNSWEQR